MRRLFTLDPTINGKGPVLFAWQKDGNFLAVSGVNRRVHVVDRQGKERHQFALPAAGPCVAIDWDCSGELLAVMQLNSSIIPIWNSNTKKLDMLDTGMKDLSFMKWSKVGPQLAVGTAKGSLLIYNRKTLKKIPVVGKHQRRITCGVWSAQNKLALGAEDRQLTISNAEGDTLDQAHVKSEPSLIQFSDMKADERAKSKENTVSVNLGGKTLLLYNTTDQENPIELAFQARYGNIVAYKWFGDGYILIGFSSGFVVVISTHLKEIGQEVNSIRFHRDNLADVTFCPALQKGASIGDNFVKVFDMSELSKMSEQRSERMELENEFGSLSRVEWTDDGQILTVSSRNGYVYTFLTKIPVLNSSHLNRVLYLTSLRELCVKDVVLDEDVARIGIDIEPSFVSLGPSSVAVGMNNTVWYYRFMDTTAKMISTRQYLTTVQTVKLSSEYAAVLMEGRVTLHPIDASDAVSDVHKVSSGEEAVSKQKVFPDKDESPITCIAMTEEFLIFGAQSGTISYFSLPDWVYVNEFRFDSGARAIYPNALGTRLVLVDESNTAFVYSPINDQAVAIDGFAPTTEKVMWDSNDWGVFVGADRDHFTTFIYSPNNRTGPSASAIMIHPLDEKEPRAIGSPVVHTTDRPFGFSPILCYNGMVTCQMQTGSMVTITMQTHQYIGPVMRLTTEQLARAFYNNLSLHHLEECWKMAFQINSPECWTALGDKALSILDIEMAIRVYRQLQQPAMVMSLERLSHLSEKNLLLGHVALLYKNFSEAQSYFMRSSCPTLALEMRRDLMHWDQALKLAETLAPDEIPIISREYAQQLEFKGDFSAALDMFRNGLRDVPEESVDEEKNFEREKIIQHNKQCNSGMARMTIRLGDIQRGFNLVMESEDKDLCQECAQIFEEMKQFNDAAALYERAGMFDKAATLYIVEVKNLLMAQKVMQQIKSPKIWNLFARAKEKEGNYRDAKEAYEKAGEMDNVVRLNVEFLNNLAEAHLIVRKTRSVDAAAIVAKHCQKTGDYKTAVEFLILAKKGPEAFELAQKQGEMQTYAEALGGAGTHDDYLAIAHYYQAKGDAANAGDFYFKCHQYSEALKLYLQCGDAQINKAIEVVGKARSDTLTHALIDFLMGESDGVPKDPNYIFRLYMALGSFEKAAKTAVVIAKQEQEVGNYRAAHKILFDTHKDLEAQKIRIPSDLKRNLMLLHSYIIVKTLVKSMNDHETSARMLIRVAKNIAKFPKHIVPILTSTVIECQRVEFKASAYEYASVLVRPEYRSQINEKYKKKIETIVRKKGGDDEMKDPEEIATPCPFCNVACPETTLDCMNCKNMIPFCIATGKHMVTTDWSYCPGCHFPALYSQFTKLIAEDKVCPMCEQEIDAAAIKKVQNPDPKSLLAAGEDDLGASTKPSAPATEATAPAAPAE